MVIMSVAAAVSVLSAQQTKNSDNMESEQIQERGKALDRQIGEFNKKISDVISSSKLLEIDVKTIPYQSNYKSGKDFVELEHHSFTRDDVIRNRIIGIKIKRIRIYTDGKNVSKIETTILDNNYGSAASTVVKIVDPNPMGGSSDNIQFTHIINAKITKDDKGEEKYYGRVLLDAKPLSQVKNDRAFPLRNEIKRDFIVPHLSLLYNSLLFVTEAYTKSLKDADENLTEFLRKSID